MVVVVVLLSGSVYWQSPADVGLQARAPAGPSVSAAPNATRQPATSMPVSARLDSTLRVLHALMRLLAFSDLHRDRAILEAIVCKRPPLVICGHIDQCWGQESRVGESLTVSVGPQGRLLSL